MINIVQEIIHQGSRIEPKNHVLLTMVRLLGLVAEKPTGLLILYLKCNEIAIAHRGCVSKTGAESSEGRVTW